ncbi:VacJ family lipoprotein (Modular protein) [Nitrospina watsonii]|uniref:VacJ family lipoprotein (Modular protein) n=1 Tax=Nitrospina watsonii TaxID=1323948 RepID=A0ABM9HD57_9BACT|nr:VacJ family lipoprotein (Modular protein) [Nitrospina watsonii]
MHPVSAIRSFQKNQAAPAAKPGHGLRVLTVLAALLMFPVASQAALYDRESDTAFSTDRFRVEIQELGGSLPVLAQTIVPNADETQPSLEEEAPAGEEPIDPRLLDDAAPTDDPFADPFGDAVYEEDPFEKKQPDIPPLSDPFEGFNRSMYTFNDTVYEYGLRPVGEVFRDYVGEEFRIALRNLYNVLLAPAKLVSCIVQGKWKKGGIVLLRTVMNVTFGWGGMLDVAGQEYGIEAVDEDFGQALGFHHIGSGPYIMLPFFGPSTARDTVGLAVDSVLNPLFWLIPNATVGAGVTTGKVVNETSFIIDDKKALDESAIDPYESVRDFYHQIRVRKIRE